MHCFAPSTFFFFLLCFASSGVSWYLLVLGLDGFDILHRGAISFVRVGKEAAGGGGGGEGYSLIFSKYVDYFFFPFFFFFFTHFTASFLLWRSRTREGGRGRVNGDGGMGPATVLASSFCS